MEDSNELNEEILVAKTEEVRVEDENVQPEFNDIEEELIEKYIRVESHRNLMNLLKRKMKLILKKQLIDYCWNMKNLVQTKKLNQS